MVVNFCTQLKPYLALGIQGKNEGSVMDFRLNAEQQEVVSRAERVAREGLAPRAAEVDASGKHPVESLRDLWKNGLLAMTAPKKYGGLGLDVLASTMVLEKLSAGCTNTANSFNMHATVLRYIDTLASDKQKAFFYGEVVKEGRLIGSWGSEPASHGGIGMKRTTIEPSGDGYVINGLKHFSTMAGACQWAMVHCNFKNSDNKRMLTHAIVPTDSPGITISPEWDTLGMRGTVSPVVTFKGCLVKKEWVLGQPGSGDKAVGDMHSFTLGDAAGYLGTAQAALDYTKEFVKKNRFDPDPAPMSHNPIIQRHVAEMALSIEGARLMLYKACCLFDESDTIGKAILTGKARWLAGGAALMVTSRALQVCGGRTAHKRYPLERHFRDARTGTLMPPAADRCLDMVGKSELGLEEMLEGLRHSTQA